jgi:flagellar FliL protein
MAKPAPDEGKPKKRSIMPLVIGIVLALVLGGGGFWATWSGLLPPGGSGHPDGASQAIAANRSVAFVAMAPMVISLAPGARSKHLSFSAQLEVAQGNEAAVQQVMPRIVDVLNGYLRAVQTEDLENPAALVRLRAQMLRRVQMVTGEGLVRDLLVTEFVLS